MHFQQCWGVITLFLHFIYHYSHIYIYIYIYIISYDKFRKNIVVNDLADLFVSCLSISESKTVTHTYTQTHTQIYTHSLFLRLACLRLSVIATQLSLILVTTHRESSVADKAFTDMPVHARCWMCVAASITERRELRQKLEVYLHI